MRLDIHLGVLNGSEELARIDQAVLAEKLGYGTAWTAESYGSDAVSPLGYLAARTSRIGLGSAVLQVPARSPAMTGMTAVTLDLLSGGRFRLGLGVSGPQVSEGWHGVAFAAPLARTREYVDVVRKVVGRETVTANGKHLKLPLPVGEGKPLRLRMHPVRDTVPIYLAAVGERSLELAGSIGDGWLGTGVPPQALPRALAAVARGRRSVGLDLSDFDVVVQLPTIIGDDVERCADQLRARAAMTLGGMGSAQTNFYRGAAEQLGFGEDAVRVAALFRAGEREAAAHAVPFDYLDATALLGPTERVAWRMREYAAAGVTALAVLMAGRPTGPAPVEQAAQAYDLTRSK